MRRGECRRPWCGCNTFVPPPPLPRSTPLVQVLRLEGRHAAAEAYQQQWELEGNYELPSDVINHLINMEKR